MHRLPTYQLLLYLLAIPVWFVTFGCTRGLDGDPIVWLGGFTACTASYTIIALSCFDSVRSLFPVGHLMTYAGAALGAALIGYPSLEGMGGVIYGLIPVGVVAIVLSGSIALLAKRIVVKLRGRPKRSVGTNGHRRCCWIALAIGLGLLQATNVIVLTTYAVGIIVGLASVGKLFSTDWFEGLVGLRLIGYLLASPVPLLVGAIAYTRCRRGTFHFQIGGLTIVLCMAVWAIMLVIDPIDHYHSATPGAERSLGGLLNEGLFWATAIGLSTWYAIRGYRFDPRLESERR